MMGTVHGVHELRATVPTGPILVMSPHFDDAALSCAALLERHEPITVYDVFTQRPEPEQVTDWDTRCGFAGSNEAIDARWAEEHDAFEGSPHVVAAVDLLEGHYRTGLRDPRDTERVISAIDSWIAENAASGPVTVALPVGAGSPLGVPTSFVTRLRARRAGTFAFSNSRDHVWVRDTALEHLRASPEVSIWLYEEYPYQFAMGGERVVPAIETWMERTAALRVLPVDRGLKAQRVAAYTSQLGLLFRSTGARAIERALPRVERYWELSPRDSA
jgi:hypothetical protein